MTENPVTAAMEAYMRTHPHRADEVEEAMASFAEDSEPDPLGDVPAVTESDRHEVAQPGSEQLSLAGDVFCPTCKGAKMIEVENTGERVRCPTCAPATAVPGRMDATTKAAIERADRAADEDWKKRADAILFDLARKLPVLTPDDLWDHIEKPREPRAAGAVWQRAQRAGYIEWKGEMVPSRNPLQHGNHVRKWYSLIHVDD